MSASFLDPTTLDASDWPTGYDRERAYLEGFGRLGSKALIENLNTKVLALRWGPTLVPVTVNNAEYENSYVCSPYTAFALYSKEEMRRYLSRFLAWPLERLVDFIGIILRAAEIGRIIHINNWMLSTNLYRPNDDFSIRDLTREVTTRFPQHFVCFRSLNQYSNGNFCAALSEAGYQLIASRQVYIFHDPRRMYLKHANARRDRQLLEKTPYRVVRHESFSDADFVRASELYRMLYIDKYSRYNPHFTAKYMRLCHHGGVMTFLGLRDGPGKLEGIVGLLIIDNVLTAPVVGYNTSRPQAEGLYRLLMALVFEEAMTLDINVNLSSGAATFKRLRGGIPHIEWSAIYDRHLSLGRRLAIDVLAKLVSAIGVPLMRRLQL